MRSESANGSTNGAGTNGVDTVARHYEERDAQIRFLLDGIRASADALRHPARQSPLRVSSALLHAAWHTGYPRAIVDSYGVPRAVNEQLAAFLGYTPDELLAMSFVDFTPEAYTHVDVAMFDAIRRGEADRYSMRKQWRHAEGHLVGAQMLVSVIQREPELLLMVQLVTP